MLLYIAKLHSIILLLFFSFFFSSIVNNTMIFFAYFSMDLIKIHLQYNSKCLCNILQYPGQYRFSFFFFNLKIFLVKPYILL